MAAGQHNPSRRALLGAAVGLPFLDGAGGEVAPPPGFTWSPSPANAGEEWEEALAAFEAAQAEVLRIEAATAGYSLDDEEALLPEHDAACEAMEGALQHMLLVPAPHLPALGIKFEAAFDHELKHSPEDDLRFRALFMDILRLHAAQRRASLRPGGPS